VLSHPSYMNPKIFEELRMKPFNIAGISFELECWKPKKNLAEAIKHIRTAAEMGADVIATPEGTLDGYISRELKGLKLSLADKGSTGYAKRLVAFKKRQLSLADKVAKCIPVVQEEASRLGVWLFFNSLDRRRGKSVYNTTFVIDPTGAIVGKYDKIHADFEVVNTLGKSHKVFQTPFADFGVLICADRQFPEAARSVALAGAQVLIINSYGMWGEGANERFIRQRAYENGMYVLFSHPKESVVIGPRGRIIAGTSSWENVVIRRIDPSKSVGRGLFAKPEMAKTYNVRPDHPGYAKAYRLKMARHAGKPPTGRRGGVSVIDLRQDF